MLTMADLQEAVAKGWTNEGYSGQFKASQIAHKHFDHALKHIRKAAQAIENMTEAADHGTEDAWRQERIPKYIADIIISAARLANVCPGVVMDLDLAVIERLREKIFPKPPEART